MKIILISFTLISILLLSGCHTAEGFGQDMKQGGQAIQNAASDNTTDK